MKPAQPRDFSSLVSRETNITTTTGPVLATLSDRSLALPTDCV